MEWKLEVVPIPVTDIDRAKAFYADQLGFAVDLDIPMGEGGRLVQLTPPGSGCSIHLSTGILKNMPPGVTCRQGCWRACSSLSPTSRPPAPKLVERGVEASPVQHMDGGVWVEGRGGDWNSFVFFSDPDGNDWVLQERPARD